MGIIRAGLATVVFTACSSLATAPQPESERVAEKRALDTSDSSAADMFENLLAQEPEGQTRVAIMTDKPMYQPGELIRFRLDVRHAQGRKALAKDTLSVELLDARDQETGKLETHIVHGVGSGSFRLPPSAPGGTYTLQVGQVVRKLTVATYRAEKLKKSLDFVRRGYRAGESVSANVSFARATGEPLANTKLSAQILVGDTAEDIVATKTDADGKALIEIALPTVLGERPSLVVMAHDGGTVEAIIRPVPVSSGKPRIALMPEGGNLIRGMSGRVFFEATDSFGEPVDVSGRIIDDKQRVVANVESTRDGLGVFELRPTKRRIYRLELDGPDASTTIIPVAENGCSLRPLDPSGATGATIRVRLECNKTKKLAVRAQALDGGAEETGSVRVPAREPVELSIPTAAGHHGLVKLTVAEKQVGVVAERTILRGSDRRMRVEVEPASNQVRPGSELGLTVRTFDEAGKPTSASLGVAVVDDAVLAMADDRNPDLFTQIILGAFNLERLPKPSFYLSDERGARAALEVLVGTKGWSRLEATTWGQPAHFAKPSYRNAKIRGAVKDQHGNGLVGVTIVATSPVVQGSRSTITEGGGFYGLTKLPPGIYQLVFYYANLTVTRTNIRVQSNKRTPVYVKIDTSNTSEQILISGSAPTIDTTSTNAGITLGNDYTKNIPIPGRTFESVLEAAAGSSNDAVGVSFSGTSSLESSYVEEGDEPAPDGPRARTRFIETVYWHPHIRTNGRGIATIKVELGDSITSYRAIAQGFSVAGFAGKGEGTFAAVKPITIEALIASHAQSGDVLDHTITLVNRTKTTQRATLTVRTRGLQVIGRKQRKVSLKPGERRALSLKSRAKSAGRGRIDIRVRAGSYSDRVIRRIDIAAAGYPREVSQSGVAGKARTLHIEVPNALRGIRSELAIVPSTVAHMTEGTEKILREPSGCFEQTSSSNYPNIMALSLLETAGKDADEFRAKALPMLERGYQKLVQFESDGGGFEWFGGSPANEALTAYGLAQFHDLSKVYDGVDARMVKRTARWLVGRRDHKGGFKRASNGLDSIGRSTKATSDAYITWALASVGEASRIRAEIRSLIKRSRTTSDGYILALGLATAALSDQPSQVVTTLSARLKAMQESDGAFRSGKDSLTSSRGVNLEIETTALAAIAFLATGSDLDAAKRAIDWLQKNRKGGGYASTQATVLTLKAMSIYGQKGAESDGNVLVWVNGQAVKRLRFRAGQTEAVSLALGKRLRPGTNSIKLESSVEVPFSLSVDYRTKAKPVAARAPLVLETTLSRKSASVGDALILRASTRNSSATGLPMTLVRLGIPAGMRVEPKELEALKKRGVVDFIETRPQEVTLYYRSIGAKQTRRIRIPLVAQVAGRLVAPPSSAALYYTPEVYSWAPSLSATIAR